VFRVFQATFVGGIQLMEIIGSVDPNAVPAGARPRRLAVWSVLARRVMIDHEQGRVTVVRLQDQAEYKKMRNGIVTYLRSRKYRLNPVIIQQADGLRVFMELQPADDQVQTDNNIAEGTSVDHPDHTKRPRQRATA
jgi:hypothetical protein